MLAAIGVYSTICNNKRGKPKAREERALTDAFYKVSYAIQLDNVKNKTTEFVPKGPSPCLSHSSYQHRLVSALRRTGCRKHGCVHISILKAMVHNMS
jgi:hypothetical protein